ncbi:MAG: hypothetical protein ACLGQH_09535, partial [Acidobacteriota bacterium]
LSHMLINAVKYFVFILVFLYLFLNWASDVNPSLRESSILIMTLINIFMLWNVLVAAMELPYRRALASCVESICTTTDLELAFSTGKRFYKLRYFWAAMTSGAKPWHFLGSIAAERTRDDLHRVFIDNDPKGSLFGVKLFCHFLRNQLNADKSMPADKRSERLRAVEALARDPWMSDKTNEFLHNLLAAPEDLMERGLKDSLVEEGKMI